MSRETEESLFLEFLKLGLEQNDLLFKITLILVKELY